MTTRGPAIVIGAGVVGLACAAALARRGWWTLMLEKEPAPGRGTSSRNSEVIHAGIYYPPGSLKARLCVEGKHRLFAYLAERGLPHARCGKFVVATEDAEVPHLERILATAAANGVGEMELMDGADVRAMEPHVRAVAGLHSTSTGIVDVHALMHSLEGDVQAAGGEIVCGAQVVGVDRAGDDWRLSVLRSDGETEELEAAVVVNAAGLYADRMAALVLGEGDAARLRQRWVKGNYFSIRAGAGVRASRLIYPCPPADLSGLGVHLTIDLDGGQRLGPDVEFIGERVEDYRVAEERGAAFCEAARRFLPGLAPADLVPAYSGLRPQRDTEGFRDFYIEHEEGAGAPGWVNLVGIESPGLTAALAIAEDVAGRLS